MSGEPEIEEWTLENYESDYFEEKGFTSTEQIYAYLNKRFEDDNRSDLDHILRDERQTFIRFLQDNYSLKEAVKQTQTDTILDYMQKNQGKDLKPKEIALALGFPQPSVRRVLQYLTRTEQIGRVAKGLYRF